MKTWPASKFGQHTITSLEIDADDSEDDNDHDDDDDHGIMRMIRRAKVMVIPIH